MVEFQELRSCFQMFDRNGDGKICANELKQALCSFGQNPSDAEVQVTSRVLCRTQKSLTEQDWRKKSISFRHLCVSDKDSC